MPYDASRDQLGGTDSSPAWFGRKASPITPSDTDDLKTYPRYVIITSAGDIVVLPMKNEDGVTVTFTGINPGWCLPIRVRRILATGTTATCAAVED